MVYDREINELLLHSSEVEELFFERDSLKIRFGNQNEWFLDTDNLTVIIIPGVYSKGTAARYNRTENIIFFADNVHKTSCLTHWNLPSDLLDTYLEAVESEIILPAAEIIPLPIQPVSLPPAHAETGFYQQPIAGGMKTQLGFKSPTRTLSVVGFFLFT